MCIVMTCFPVCDVTNFEINLIFFIKPFSYMTRIVRTKPLKNENSFLDETKSLFHRFTGLSLKQIKSTFRECESPTLRKMTRRKQALPIPKTSTSNTNCTNLGFDEMMKNKKELSNNLAIECSNVNSLDKNIVYVKDFKKTPTEMLCVDQYK